MLIAMSMSTTPAAGCWAPGRPARWRATPRRRGIATNGTDVWIVDAKSDKVFKYTGAATRLSGSQNAASSFSLNSGNKDASDIVTDGTHLWVVNDSSTDKVFKYTRRRGAGWEAGRSPRPACAVRRGSRSIRAIRVISGSSTAAPIASISTTPPPAAPPARQSASTDFALAAGNTNPQGIADPPPPELVDAVLADGVSDDPIMDVVPATQPSADDHDAALFSIMAEFEQVWARPSGKVAII